MAVGFGSSWNDAALGNDWGSIPDGVTLVRDDVLFAMLRLLVENKSIAPPDHGKADALWKLRSQSNADAEEEPESPPPARQR